MRLTIQADRPLKIVLWHAFGENDIMWRFSSISLLLLDRCGLGKSYAVVFVMS